MILAVSTMLALFAMFTVVALVVAVRKSPDLLP